MPYFFPENNRSLPSDDEMRSLAKIVDLGGGGSGGSSSAAVTAAILAAKQVYQGASPPATPNNPALEAVFYPNGGGSVQQWDIPSQAWV